MIIFDYCLDETCTFILKTGICYLSVLEWKEIELESSEINQKGNWFIDGVERWCPLHFACAEGDKCLETIKVLIDSGANYMLRSLEGVDCAYNAASGDAPGKLVLEYLSSLDGRILTRGTFANRRLIIGAAYKNNHQNVDYILKNGGKDSINIPDEFGHTALTIAAETYGDMKMIEKLIQHGSDPNYDGFIDFEEDINEKGIFERVVPQKRFSANAYYLSKTSTKTSRICPYCHKKENKLEHPCERQLDVANYLKNITTNTKHSSLCYDAYYGDDNDFQARCLRMRCPSFNIRPCLSSSFIICV